MVTLNSTITRKGDHLTISTELIGYPILYLTDWSIDPFTPNIHNIRTPKTVSARDLKFWHNVNYQSCDMCHVSSVTCHVSHVTLLFVFFCFFWKIDGAGWLRVCYQQGLHRLVFIAGIIFLLWTYADLLWFLLSLLFFGSWVVILYGSIHNWFNCCI